MSQGTIEGMAVLSLTFIGLPTAWVALWAFARFVNHRWPHRY